MITEMVSQKAYDRLNKKRAISEHELDKDSKSQPDLYQEVCENLADAWLRFEASKLEEKNLAPETELRIRKEQEDVGNKVTEGKIKALVDTDKALQEKRLEALLNEYEYMKWSSLRRSYEMRKDTINNLLKYYHESYDAYDN